MTLCSDPHHALYVPGKRLPPCPTCGATWIDMGADVVCLCGTTMDRWMDGSGVPVRIVCPSCGRQPIDLLVKAEGAE